MLKKKKVNKSSFSVNFRSFFFSLDNENKMSAFQMLAISLSGSFCQEIANSLHCKPDRRSLQCDSYWGSSWHSSHAPLPASLTQHRETLTPRAHRTTPLCPQSCRQGTCSYSLTCGEKTDHSPSLQRLISKARAADSKTGLDVHAASPQTSPQTDSVP